jgi:cardiolipin synthase
MFYHNRNRMPSSSSLFIVSAKGLLSPEKSKVLMGRLKRSVAPTDMLQRHSAVIESVSGSPLTNGNMDFWSFSSNDEVNAVILSREFAAEMGKMFARDIAVSHEIRLEEWGKRPMLNRIKEWFAHQFELGCNRSSTNGE